MPERTVRLRLRTTLTPEQEAILPLVHCPRSDVIIDARGCTGCVRMRSLEWSPTEGGEVLCCVSETPPVVDARADLAEQAARAHVRDVLAPVTLCVPLETKLDHLIAIFAQHRHRAVVVIDREQKPRGVVARAAIGGAAPQATAADLMVETLHPLPEDAPLSYLLSLFAVEDITETPVVGPDGAVLGLCYSRDVITWVATRLGYVVR